MDYCVSVGDSSVNKDRRKKYLKKVAEEFVVKRRIE